MTPFKLTIAPITALLIAAALLFISVAFPVEASAQSAIRVLVNDEPITSYDIKARTKMLSVFTNGREGEKAAIEQLIEERLMMQEAKLRNVDVSDEEIEQEFANRARAAQLTPDRFTQAMRQAGIDPRSFKNFLRANMAWQQIVRARFRATVNISDQDVTAALAARESTEGEQQNEIFEYRLMPILFVVPSGAGAGAESQQRKEAEAFRAAFQGCDSALQLAQGKPGIVVRPQVRREESQVAPALKDVMKAMEIGGTTPPERVPEGIQIVALCAKNVVAGETEASAETRQEISTERGELLARRYLRDLRSDAVIEFR